VTIRSSVPVILGLAAFCAPSAPLLGQSNFGTAVAVAGDQVFVGQPANFYGPGMVYLYEAGPGGEWTERGRLAAPDSSQGVAFGASLAVVEDLLLVGAPATDRAGSVHLYRGSAQASTWVATGPVAVPGSAAGDQLGAALALAGGEAFVGAPGAAGTGLVHHVRVAGQEPEAVAALSPSGLAPGAQFGASLSLDGDLLLIGAPQANSGAGAAVVYRRDSGGAWSEDGVLSGQEVLGQAQARLGSSVLLHQGRAFVGAPLGEGGTGTVLVFDSGPEGWALSGQLRSFEGVAGARFGSALARRGGDVWVGAPGALGGDGIAYRFVEGDPTWSRVEAVTADSANTAAWPFGFGSAIAVGNDAVAIGMPRRDFGEGRAAVFARTGDGWQESSTLMGEIFTAVSDLEEAVDCTDGKIAVFDCSNMELVSFLPVSALGGDRGVWVNDVWGWTDPQTGKEYALVSRRDGAAFVDVSNPAQLRLVGSLPRTQGSRPSVWRDIKVYDDHAFIVSDGAGAHGMQVFDLSRLREVTGDPVTFTADAHYDRVHSAHNVVANTESGFLYIVGSNGGGETCGGGLHIVDARTPQQPTFAGCYTDASGANASGATHDAQCVTYRGPDERYQGREICVASNGSELNIADVTDKSAPTPISRSSYPNVAYAHQGWFDESQRYFYMGDESDELQGNIAGTRTLVWDLSELDDPVVAHEYIGPVQATDHNLFIKGDRAYMSNYGSGLRVIDITNRENPQEVAFLDTAPLGNNEAGMSSTSSGAWSNYPFFDSGLVIFTSVREGLFMVRVKPTPLVP